MATSGIGGSGFLAAELFKSMARADRVRMNYKSGGLAITELMSGEVQLFFANSSRLLASPSIRDEVHQAAATLQAASLTTM